MEAAEVRISLMLGNTATMWFTKSSLLALVLLLSSFVCARATRVSKGLTDQQRRGLAVLNTHLMTRTPCA